MGDAKAVGLVAHALDQVQLRRVVIQQDRLFPVGEEDFLLLFRQAEHGHIRSHVQQGLPGEAQLLGAAVDQHQIRQVAELAPDGAEPRRLPLGLLLQAVGEAPPQHLVQGGEVVGALHGLDAEVAVFLLRRYPVDEHHHACHAQYALGVGNVVALDAPGSFRQAQRPAQGRCCAGGALLPDGCAGVALLQGVGGVLGGQQHQVVLLAPLGGGQGHRAALLPAEPLLQLLLRPLRQRLHQHIAGDQVRVLIVLGQEGGQHLAGLLAALAGQGEAVPADHPAAPDVHRLHHGVQPVLGNGQDVLLRRGGLDGDLPLHQPLHVPDLVPEHRSLLVLHAPGGIGHVLLQAADHFGVIAPQEGQHPVQHVPVLRLGALARAGGQALADLVIHAGAAGRFQGQRLFAGAQGEHIPHRADDLLHRRCADVGAEVLRAVLLHAPGQGQAGEGLLQIHPQVGVVLVVLEEDVVVGPVQLDEVALQAQGLQVAVAQENVEIRDVADHGRDLGSVGRIAEVGADTVFQIDRLAHIDDGTLRVLHQVAAGAFGQLGNLQLQIFAPVNLRHGRTLPSCRGSGSFMLNNGLVVGSELGQGVDDGQHLPAQRRQPVLHPRGHLMIIMPVGKPVIHHLAQAVRQHLLGYAVQIPLQLVEPPGPCLQVAQDQQLPFPADQGNRRGHRAVGQLSLRLHGTSPPGS